MDRIPRVRARRGDAQPGNDGPSLRTSPAANTLPVCCRTHTRTRTISSLSSATSTRASSWIACSRCSHPPDNVDYERLARVVEGLEQVMCSLVSDGV
jgi:hypothetical protein